MLTGLSRSKDAQGEVLAKAKSSEKVDDANQLSFDDGEVVTVDLETSKAMVPDLVKLIQVDYFNQSERTNVSSASVMADEKTAKSALNVAPLKVGVSPPSQVDAKKDVPPSTQAVSSVAVVSVKNLKKSSLSDLLTANLSKKEFVELRSILFEKINLLITLLSKNSNSIDPVLLKEIDKQAAEVIEFLADRKIDKAGSVFDKLLKKLTAYQFDFSTADPQVKKEMKEHLEKAYDKFGQLMKVILRVIEKSNYLDKAAAPYEFLGVLDKIPVFQKNVLPIIISSPVLFSKFVGSVNYLALFCGAYPQYERQVIKMVMAQDELFKNLFTGTFPFDQFRKKFPHYEDEATNKLLSKNSFAFFKQTIFQSTPRSLKWFCDAYPEYSDILLKQLIKDVEKGSCTPDELKQYRYDFPELIPIFDKAVSKSRSSFKK